MPEPIDENPKTTDEATKAKEKVPTGTGAKPEDTRTKDAKSKDAKPKAKRPKAEKKPKEPSKPLSVRRGVMVGAVAAAAVIGAGATYAITGGVKAPISKTTVSKDDAASTVVASWSKDGKAHDVKAKDVYDWSGTSADSDGSYDIPDSSLVLSYVQSTILTQAAENEGVTVSDDEITDYIHQNYGDDTDASTLAKSSGFSEDTVKSSVRDVLMQNKLRDKVVGASDDDPSEPEAPDTPTDSDTSAKTKAYADYIVKLAKSMDEWDDKANNFKDDSAIKKALDGTDFSTDSASYEEATTAYYAAYQEYAPTASKQSQKWTDYKNDLYKDVVFTMYSIETY